MQDNYNNLLQMSDIFLNLKFFFGKDAREIDKTRNVFKKNPVCKSDCEKASSTTNTYSKLARDCSFRLQFRPSLQSVAVFSFRSDTPCRAEILI